MDFMGFWRAINSRQFESSKRKLQWLVERLRQPLLDTFLLVSLGIASVRHYCVWVPLPYLLKGLHPSRTCSRFIVFEHCPSAKLGLGKKGWDICLGLCSSKSLAKLDAWHLYIDSLIDIIYKVASQRCCSLDAILCTWHDIEISLKFLCCKTAAIIYRVCPLPFAPPSFS